MRGTGKGRKKYSKRDAPRESASQAVFDGVNTKRASKKINYDALQGAFGFRMPETMRAAMVENLHQADPYSHQKGIFQAREAVVMQQQSRGVMNVTADDVYIGNGVSELILLAMRSLINTGDEVLVPSPDYPLWTASVTLNGGTAVHYPCPPERGFLPDIAELRKCITPRTRAIVIITPNNPTGAVYPRALLQEMVALAEQHHL